MFKGQTLRSLVNERLAAAAEDIVVLFERTIAEYVEDLCRFKEENQRKQQLQDNALSPRIELVTANVQIPSASPGPSLKQEIAETPQIKEEREEQIVKQEEEQLAVPLPFSSAACVRTEESLLLQQSQTYHREDTLGEDISSEPHFHLETEGHTEHSPDLDNDDNWEPSFSWSAPQMETEADVDHYNQVQITKLCPQNKSALETNATVHSRDIPGAVGDEWKKHQCPFCEKKFARKENLERHIRVHTGEKPYTCSVCEKTFADQSTFRRHKKVVHTGEKTFSCTVCKKNFAHKYTLEYHRRTHTGEKPYSCPDCEKTFADHSTYRRHIRTHTGEQPFSCSICNKTFARKDNLRTHMSIHSIDTDGNAS